MSKLTDVQIVNCALYYLPIEARIPLKFGPETVTSVVCARARMEVRNAKGQSGVGWGETPLSVQWVWPSTLPYEMRLKALQAFTEQLACEWGNFGSRGHAIEIGHDFIEHKLPAMLKEFNKTRSEAEVMPWLAALVCASAFDIALHDAYGVVNEVQVYRTYNAEFMNRDLASFITAEESCAVSFAGKYPEDFLVEPPSTLPAWHLVGGKDWIMEAERDSSEPKDGYPVMLRDWIQRDGLKCLKIKLRGDDADWDCERMRKVGEIALEEGVTWLTADFNCTVRDPIYVNAMLDKFLWDYPEIYARLLYVEQPFPYDLEKHQIDVHSVSARKPLFMDESAHDWPMIKLGRRLGWTGVALKTCKTQTGALLSLSWARAHGMTLMVQDLSNPMLAQIPHLLLAAHAGTIMGVETNGMQFYPQASEPEAKIHPGIYQRRQGRVDLSTLRGPGFGYRVEEIRRDLGDVVAS
jgi:L-alanine-DL-glutamate epimerase-like enolase superfamily enzyme